MCTLLNTSTGLIDNFRCNETDFLVEDKERLRKLAEHKLNMSKSLKGSTGGMSTAVLGDAVPGEDATGMASENLQVSSAKSDPGNAQNASVGPALPPGAGPNATAPAFALPESMFDGMNASEPLDMAATNFADDPNSDAAAANDPDAEPEVPLGGVAALGFSAGGAESKVEGLAVPIVIEMPITLPPTPPFFNCTQLLIDNNQSDTVRFMPDLTVTIDDDTEPAGGWDPGPCWPHKSGRSNQDPLKALTCPDEILYEFRFNYTFQTLSGNNYTAVPVPGKDCTYEPPTPELPKCKWFDNDANVWQTSGCIGVGFKNNDGSELRSFPDQYGNQRDIDGNLVIPNPNTTTGMLCECDHLTEFSGLQEEMTVELEINVVDPVGDAAMLLNISPDNMLPLIALMCCYISYSVMVWQSHKNKKRFIEKKQAKFMIGEDMAASEDEEEESESESESSSGSESSQDETLAERYDKNMKLFKEGFGEGLKEEHIFGSILYCDPEDNYGQPQRLTTLYCFLLGILATDGIFSAGSAAEPKTMMSKLVQCMLVSAIMFPCNFLFTFLFSKAKPAPIPIINYRQLQLKLQRAKRFQALMPERDFSKPGKVNFSDVMGGVAKKARKAPKPPPVPKGPGGKVGARRRGATYERDAPPLPPGASGRGFLGRRRGPRGPMPPGARGRPSGFRGPLGGTGMGGAVTSIQRGYRSHLTAQSKYDDPDGPPPPPPPGGPPRQ